MHIKTLNRWTFYFQKEYNALYIRKQHFVEASRYIIAGKLIGYDFLLNTVLATSILQIQTFSIFLTKYRS